MAALCCGLVCSHFQPSPPSSLLNFVFSCCDAGLSFSSFLRGLGICVSRSDAALYEVVSFPHLPLKMILQSFSCFLPDENESPVLCHVSSSLAHFPEVPPCWNLQTCCCCFDWFRGVLLCGVVSVFAAVLVLAFVHGSSSPSGISAEMSRY